ncbi:MAE_28990/MAE_18760 family HEPN-like nuclease [Vibrio vulnificus]|uniref:MAE_28990/MAE_18760 family HEPN-like nuclease n=1 Tax=Vibrio vulnificus TaxID=672 RepID=UPI003ED912BA
MAKLTIEDFIDLINEDLVWRKKEISDLLFLHNEDNNHLILKSAILLMYSHWEGYIKNISKQYLMLISDLDLELNKLGINFEAIDIKADIKNCFDSSQTLNLVNEITFLTKIYTNNKKFKLPSSFKKEKDKSVINTRDNLNIDTFQSFLKILGVYDFKPLKTRIQYIDEKLLNNRNIIAHGSKIHPNTSTFNMDIEEIKKLRNFIVLIMEYLRDELVYFAEKELYLYTNLDEVMKRSMEVNKNLEHDIKSIYPE